MVCVAFFNAYVGFSLFLEALVQPSNSVSVHYKHGKEGNTKSIRVEAPKKKMNFGITLAFLVSRI